MKKIGRRWGDAGRYGWNCQEVVEGFDRSKKDNEFGISFMKLIFSTFIKVISLIFEELIFL